MGEGRERDVPERLVEKEEEREIRNLVKRERERERERVNKIIKHNKQRGRDRDRDRETLVLPSSKSWLTES